MKNCICSLTIVCLVTVLTNFSFCVIVGSSP